MLYCRHPPRFLCSALDECAAFPVAADLEVRLADRHADNGLSTQEKGIKGLFVHNLAQSVKSISLFSTRSLNQTKGTRRRGLFPPEGGGEEGGGGGGGVINRLANLPPLLIKGNISIICDPVMKNALAPKYSPDFLFCYIRMQRFLFQITAEVGESR